MTGVDGLISCSTSDQMVKERECDLQRRQLATQTITHQKRQNKNKNTVTLIDNTTFQVLVGINLIHVNIALLQKT